MSCLLVIRPSDLQEGIVLTVVSAVASFTTVALLRKLSRMLQGGPPPEEGTESGQSINLQKERYMARKTLISRRGRDARTGRFISVPQTRRFPDTTVLETIRHATRIARRRKRVPRGRDQSGS